MPWIALAFLAGHCAVLWLPELPPAVPFVWLLVVSVGVCAVVRVFTGAAVALGALAAWFACSGALEVDLAPSLEGEDLVVRGEVISLVERSGAGLQFDLQLLGAHTGLPLRARVDWYDAPVTPAPGEQWQLLVRLKQRHGFANPGGFDYEGHLFRSGIGATGYVRASDDNQRIAGAGRNAWLLRAREHIANKLAAATRGHPMTGVLQGLSVGVQHEMSPEQWRVFAATGTTHLMAISGLHIGMIAAAFAWLGGQCVRRYVPERWGFIALHGQAAAGSMAAIVYCALAGMSVPTQRTLIMLLIYFAVRLLRRSIDVPHGLGLALICVLLVDPFAPLAPGAWLSFLAVAAILIATAGTHARRGVLREFGRVQVAVTIGLLPVIIGAFGSVSLISPIANAVAVPVFTMLVVPLTLLSALLALVSIDVASLFVKLPLTLLDITWLGLERMSRWDLAMWHMPSLPWWSYGLLAAGVLLLLLPAVWPMRVTGVILCLPALLYSPPRPGAGEARVDVLDVGQGLAVVVTTENHSLVYDTGPAFRSGRDSAEMVLLPYLRHEGIRRLDKVVVSHSDQDHAGGLATLRDDMPVVQLLHGPSLSERAGVRCEQGQQWQWDGVNFEILHPAPQAEWADNDSSCVLLVRAAGSTALLTGDIEAAAEESLASQLAQVDVLTIPHHGSKTSSTEGFVAETRPQYAIASAGYRNRWGFPKQEIVRRWEAIGATVLATASTGAIRFHLTAAGVQAPSFHRVRSRRLWHSSANPACPSRASAGPSQPC